MQKNYKKRLDKKKKKKKYKIMLGQTAEAATLRQFCVLGEVVITDPGRTVNIKGKSHYIKPQLYAIKKYRDGSIALFDKSNITKFQRGKIESELDFSAEAKAFKEAQIKFNKLSADEQNSLRNRWRETNRGRSGHHEFWRIFEQEALEEEFNSHSKSQ